MRVLWFSSRPPNGVRSSDKLVGEGWIESLERELMANSEIELGIVFNELAKSPEKIKSKCSRTTYFMVPRHPYSKFNRWFNRFMGRPPSIKRLPDYLDTANDYKPDLILFFGTEFEFPLIIPQLKIPTIIWFQGNLTVYERMYESGIRLKRTIFHEKLKDILMGNTIFHNYLRFQHLVKQEKQIFSLAENFIGRTDWDRRLVKIMAPQARYFHCDEAMRKPFWKDKWAYQPNRNKFIITTTIRGNLYKGLETVLEASDLLSKVMEKAIEWRVMGISEGTAYVAAAQKKMGIHSSKSNVNLLGNKSSEELAQELLNADLYVHPSHIENSPNGVQEAMLLGMPVIATNVGGTPSLLIDGKEGLLVQNKDPYALAGAILELYESPDKAKEMGANARKRAIVRNDSKKICAELLDIFNELVK
ncbi:glycosyltransferase family 4 protein [Pareuzebyella sediminis]|uniref:glycosyltransferase family 4 protein n=1 Tax=Pareuzebyella sediminis TaxID=2607998 RepID=UPI0011EF9423|nr:glycosyltransferase [Pareuzebyella sediminis]